MDLLVLDSHGPWTHGICGELCLSCHGSLEDQSPGQTGLSHGTVSVCTGTPLRVNVKDYSSGNSQVVTHPGTNPARRCLASVILGQSVKTVL